MLKLKTLLDIVKYSLWVKKISPLRASRGRMYRVLHFELVKELSVQQLLAYGILYLQTSSDLPLY